MLLKGPNSPVSGLNQDQAFDQRLAQTTLLDLPNEVLYLIADEVLADAIQVIHNFRRSIAWRYCQRHLEFSFEHLDIDGPVPMSTALGALTDDKLWTGHFLDDPTVLRRFADEFTACDTVLAVLEDMCTASPVLADVLKARARLYDENMLAKCRTARANLQRACDVFIEHWINVTENCTSEEVAELIYYKQFPEEWPGMGWPCPWR